MRAIKKEPDAAKYRDWHNQPETSFSREIMILAVCMAAAAVTAAAITGRLDSILAPLFHRMGI